MIDEAMIVIAMMITGKTILIIEVEVFWDFEEESRDRTNYKSPSFGDDRLARMHWCIGLAYTSLCHVLH